MGEKLEMTIIRCSDCLGWTLDGFPFLLVVVLAGRSAICSFLFVFHTPLSLYYYNSVNCPNLVLLLVNCRRACDYI